MREVEDLKVVFTGSLGLMSLNHVSRFWSIYTVPSCLVTGFGMISLDGKQPRMASQQKKWFRMEREVRCLDVRGL